MGRGLSRTMAMLMAACAVGLASPAARAEEPLNVVLILADDHRYDAMGVAGHPFLETPHLDSLARNGAYLKNAFVTTALCSPSRASILTGQYAHRHRVVDNNNPVPPGTVFFPQLLQKAGYETAFVGKWHMGGESDAPQPGFDRWVSFRGQGTYLPSKNGLNVDGKHLPQKGYITDELTDYAVDWLKGRPAEKPFFLYLSHKGVHANFTPADRHKGRYAGKPIPESPNFHDTTEQAAVRPAWVKNQRNSHHGVEFPYHSDTDLVQFYRDYCETLLAIDDSVGRVLDQLKAMGRLERTLVIYMGDNGFQFGEHGLIDKRVAYEESMRVPMLAQCPAVIKPGTVVTPMVANLDIAPTVLDAAGIAPPANIDGRSFLPLLRGETPAWRTSLLYEYYWERNFPQTPTIFALRTDRYKFVRAHGIWDLDELYDLEADPYETTNLIERPEQRENVQKLKHELFATLEATGGLSIPLYEDRGGSSNLRNAEGSRAADLPPAFYRAKPPGNPAR